MKFENYTPTYFLSALGAGGLSVSFFIYLLFFVPHPNVPLATFDFVFDALSKGNILSLVVTFSLVFIIAFALLHFQLLYHNIQAYKAFRKSDAYHKLLSSNSQISLMTIPLTFTMTINVCFVLGAVFVPGLWGVVEYLFPFALLGFAITGYFALKIFAEYFTRILVSPSFDFVSNNNLTQMISIFTFSMIGVGFAAPGAMSHVIPTSAIGLFGAVFFTTIAILLLVIKLLIGFKSIFKQGIHKETSPSLWIVIPILTLIGITVIRIKFGLDHQFAVSVGKMDFFILGSIILSLQIVFGLLGFMVMKKIGYFEEFVHSDKKSAISFALICPGVAFMVFGMFFIHYGLVFSEIVTKYSLFYFLFMAPFIFVQYKTVVYFFKLRNKFL